jgi:GT2 family glycosyltransferase
MAATELLPISIVLATRERPMLMMRALKSIYSDANVPAECIVIDASSDENREAAARHVRDLLPSSTRLVFVEALQSGAAVQRNQGTAHATQPLILYCDDDIICEPRCIESLWRAIQSDRALGGVNAMITNQHYGTPGLASRALYAFMNGRREASYAGRVLGPAINLLPADDSSLPEIVPVHWLNTTCTLYRREALPDQPFDPFFTGYSLMEDVTLSLRVGCHWKLANARTARIFHDSQPSAQKSDAFESSRMELVNRHYVMTSILQRRDLADYVRLSIWELFQVATAARGGDARSLWRTVRGKVVGLRQLAADSGRIRHS